MDNKIYFNIPKYGGLYIDYIILEESFPILFVLKNYRNDFFISLCYEIKDKQSWILNKVDIKHLVDLFTGKIDLRNIFLYNKNESKIIINMSYDTKYETIKYVSENNLINMGILFDESDFLDNEDGEYTEYLRKLNNINNKNNYIFIINKNIDSNEIIKRNFEGVESLLSIDELELYVDFCFKLDSFVNINKYNRHKNYLSYLIKKNLIYSKLISNTYSQKNVSIKERQIDFTNINKLYKVYIGV